MGAILAAGALALRGSGALRQRARGRHVRNLRPGEIDLPQDVFDARPWPAGGPTEVPFEYHRPAEIRADDPAILPPPRQLREEDIE